MTICYEKEAPALVFGFLSHLEVERGLSTTTIYHYFIDLRLFFHHLLEEKPFYDLTLEDVSGVTRGDVFSFLSWLTKEKQAKASTKNRKIAVLSSFYGFLVDMEILGKNVMSQVPTSKPGKSLPKYLDEPGISALLGGVEGAFCQRDLAILSLMVSGGLRVSEVHGLNLNSFRTDRVSLVGKGKKERQVYLSAGTQEAVLGYLALRPEVDLEALFISRHGTRLSVRGIQAMTEKYLRKIGHPELSCHKLRHTAATQMLKHGCNLREIQEILGHESVSTTEIYTHVTNQELRLAVSRLTF